MNKRETRKHIKRFRIGFNEGREAYARWFRNPGTPMPVGSVLASTLPGCSDECPCMSTMQGWEEGWAHTDEHGIPRWL